MRFDHEGPAAAVPAGVLLMLGQRNDCELGQPRAALWFASSL
jgi:hypothetical protein